MGRPAAARHSRIWYLSRAVLTATARLDVRPRRSAIAAAATEVRSSTPTTARSGCARLKSATTAAAPSGSAKSRVRKLSGRCASSVLGRSDAQTRSTSSDLAAARKSSVRYVVVGRSSSSRSIGLPPADPRDLGLAGGVVGVAPAGVVGGVEHLDHFRQLVLDQPLDPRLQRDVRRPAPLAAAAHLQIHAVVLHVDEVDVPAVPGDGRVDHGVDQLLHLAPQFLTHGSPLSEILSPGLRLRQIRANWPVVGSAQQNQGSVRRGGRDRFGCGSTVVSAADETPAAASARATMPANVTCASCLPSAPSATAALTSACSRSMR